VRRARVSLREGREDADGGGLAGAVGAKQPADRTTGDGEVDAAEGVGVLVALAEDAFTRLAAAFADLDREAPTRP
jgi:hypothetical protein